MRTLTVALVAFGLLATPAAASFHRAHRVLPPHQISHGRAQHLAARAVMDRINDEYGGVPVGARWDVGVPRCTSRGRVVWRCSYWFDIHLIKVEHYREHGVFKVTSTSALLQHALIHDTVFVPFS